MTSASTHEDLQRAPVIGPGSERAFGVVFAVVFGIVAMFPLVAGATPRLWALAVAAAFLIVAVMKPGLLRPLNLVWFRFGMLLHRIVNPVVMGFLFYIVITPIGLLMRLSGKNPLALGFDRDTASYWISRQPPGPAPETMKNQF